MLFLSHNRYVALPLLCSLILWTGPWPIKQAKQAKSRPAKEFLYFCIRSEFSFSLLFISVKLGLFYDLNPLLVS